MAGFVVSVLVEHLEQLAPSIEGLHVHGANVNIARHFVNLLGSPEIEALEVFLPPDQYQRREAMAEIASKILPEHRKGKGALRFYPVYALPEVWADGAERILLCVDPNHFARDRYLRDRFAVGPTAISCQTHGMGSVSMYQSLARLKEGPSVPFDVLTCLSKACLESFERTFDGYLGELPCRLSISTNAVDLETFQPYGAEEKRHARQMLDLPEDATICLYLSRLTPYSKADLLPVLRCFAEVSGPKDLLLIAGPENVANYADRLKLEVKELGLGDRCEIRTTVPPWATSLFYGSADLFILPSDNVQEALGTAVLEAMASGLAVIGSDWDGLRDSVVDGETGYLIPSVLMPGLGLIGDMSPAVPSMTSFLMTSQNAWMDTRVFSMALQRLLRLSEERKAMGKAGRARAEELNSWSSVSAKLFALWRELLESARDEDPGQKEARQSRASSIGLPVPFLQLFGTYPTHCVSAEMGAVRLTKLGAAILDGKERLQFYDETIPLVRPELMEVLMAKLRQAPQDWLNLGLLADEASAKSRLSRDLALFHIGLLLKRGVIEVPMPAAHSQLQGMQQG
ncbi:MAG TPA: glycosyltransferase [Fimbriimonas sp.]|nr:glycosyltransferase [Fimbriimonas sp.]